MDEVFFRFDDGFIDQVIFSGTVAFLIYLGQVFALFIKTEKYARILVIVKNIIFVVSLDNSSDRFDQALIVCFQRDHFYLFEQGRGC